MKIRELPRYEGIANDMGDFFSPKDASSTDILIRTGMIKSESVNVVECVMAYTSKESEWGFNLLVYGKYNDTWELSTSMCNTDHLKEIMKLYLK